MASAEANVNSNLAFTYEINPDLSNLDFSQTKNIDALVRATDAFAG